MKFRTLTICLAVTLLVGMSARTTQAKGKPKIDKSASAESDTIELARAEQARAEQATAEQAEVEFAGAESGSVESTRDKLRYAPDTLPEAPDVAALLRRLVMGTAIVLGLCVCTLLLGKRWLRGAPTRATGGNSLRLVETVSLGNRCVVHLIQTGEHQVLVGVDATGVKSLVPLPQSFERAIANAGSPDFDSVENFEASGTVQAAR